MNNGLSIRFFDDAGLSYSKKPTSLNLIFRLILCIVGFVSAFTMFEGFFHFGFPIAGMIVYCIVFLLFSTVFYLAKSKTIRLSIAGIFLLNILYLISKGKQIIIGACISIYEYIKFVNRDYSYFEEIATKGLEEFERSDCILYFSLAVCTIVILLLVYSALFHSNFVLGFLATFPFFELGMYWGIDTYLASLLGLVVFWVALMAVQLITFTVRKGSRQNNFVFIRKKNTYQFTSSKQGRFAGTQIGILMFLVCFLCFIIIFSAASLFNYSRPEILNSYRYHISYSIRNFSFDDVINEIKEEATELFTPDNQRYVGGISDGNLGDVDRIEYENINVLEVISSDRPKASIYLKAFALADYKGDEWETLPTKIYEKSSFIFDNARDSGVFISNISGYILSNTEPAQSSAKISSLTVRNLSADKDIVFFPSLGYPAEAFRAEYDIKALARFDTYNYRYLNSSYVYADDLYSLYSNPSISEYDTLLSDYKMFVYDNYLEFDVKKYSEIYEKFKDSAYTATLSSLTSKAQTYLWEHASYSTEPGKTPMTKDFINYFLYESHKGYCSHFASAGVMIFRSAGIPARYVEGFIVTPDQFVPSNGGYVADVKDNSAHAWVEIYLDDFGWLPVEMTPGGYSSNSNPNASLSQDDNNDSLITTRPVSPETNSSTNKTASDSHNNQNNNVSGNSNASSANGGNSGSNGNGSNSGSNGSGGNIGSSSGGNQNGTGTSQGNVTSNESSKEPFFENAKDAVLNFVKANKDILLIIGMSIFCIALIIIVILIRRFVIIKIRMSKVFSADKNSSVRFMFSDIQGILSLWGFEYDTSNEIELIEKINSSSPVLAKQLYTLYSIASKAKFSTHAITESDFTLARESYDRVLKFTRLRLGKLGRLCYKYIFVFGYK